MSDHGSGFDRQFPVGLLEYLNVRPGRTSAEKQETAFHGALLAEQVGYHRVWIPEHHGAGSPSASPILVAAVIGSHTTHIRVGTAVSLLRVRDPYLTLVDFHQAAQICGGRLDIGLGRGDVGGPPARLVAHLRKSDEQVASAFEDFPGLIAEYGEVVEPLPGGCQVWLHGSGIKSAELAVKLGFNYCHALFLNPDVDVCARALRHHREGIPDARTAVALTVAVNPGNEARTQEDDRIGLRISCAGSADDCARMARRAVALTGADELVVAEMSGDRARHLLAVEQLHAALRRQMTHREAS